jgi:hypothetical protein
MSDKVGIEIGLLGDLSSASSFGLVPCVNGIFKLKRKEWYEKLSRISEVGGNLVRVLAWSLYESPSLGEVFCPWDFDKSRGLFDLSKYSNNYFDVVSEAAYIATMVQPKGPNTGIHWDMLDDCGFRPNVIHLQPWSNNIQGISTIYDETVEIYQYVLEAIRRLKGIVKFGLGNELSTAIGVMQPAWHGTRMFGKIMPMFKQEGVPIFAYGACVDIAGEMANTSALKGMSCDAEIVYGINESIAIARPVHSCSPNSPFIQKPCEWWGGNGHAAIFSDDGVSPRPGSIQWQDMVRYVLDNYPVSSGQFNMWGKVRVNFEHCAKTTDVVYEASIISAMAQEIERDFGPGTPSAITLENRGKTIGTYEESYPEIIIPPIEEPPIDDTPTVPTKPPFSLKGWFNNNWGILLLLISIGVIIWLLVKC